MRIKKHLRLSAERAMLHLKNIGLLFFVPLIIVDILIPALNIMEFFHYGISDSLYLNILQYTQLFIPLFSVWWVLFTLREYVESDGNEVLYVHSDRCKLIDAFCLFFIYMLNVFALYGIYTALFPNMIYEFIKILSICLFYLGLVYFTVYLTKSITITLMLILLYTLANSVSNGNHRIYLLYYSLEPITLTLYFNTYFSLVLSGVVLLFIGAVFNKMMLKSS